MIVHHLVTFLLIILIDIDMEVNFKIKMLKFSKRFEEKTFCEFKKMRIL